VVLDMQHRVDGCCPEAECCGSWQGLCQGTRCNQGSKGRASWW
jgi:hypothetical protein